MFHIPGLSKLLATQIQSRAEHMIFIRNSSKLDYQIYMVSLNIKTEIKSYAYWRLLCVFVCVGKLFKIPCLHTKFTFWSFNNVESDTHKKQSSITRNRFFRLPTAISRETKPSHWNGHDCSNFQLHIIFFTQPIYTLSLLQLLHKIIYS